MRKGEHVPAPIPVDVSGGAETGTQPAVLTARKPVKPAPRNHASSPAPVSMDVHGHDDTAEPAPAESEAQKVVPADQLNSPPLAPVEVADGKAAKAEPAREPWVPPGTPSGPLWRRR
jgi:hypothetical protein